jgi:DNA adenine methylase
MQNRYSPLRYPGGKGKLTGYLQAIFDANDLNDGHYVEPYAGGASVAIGLLLLGNASHVHINDLNPAVHAFWKAVLDYTDELCKKITYTPVTPEEWRNQKAIYKSPQEHSAAELGFATFFLNRTNRSGILNAGMIGGNNQTGEWKIDARYNKDELIGRIKKIALYKKHITLYNQDALQMLGDIHKHLPQQSLIYLDPPYYHQGQHLYQNHYKHDDHTDIAKFVQNKLKFPWIVSYDNEAAISYLYYQKRSIIYNIGYSAKRVYEGEEIIVFSDGLNIPPIHPVTSKLLSLTA